MRETLKRIAYTMVLVFVGANSTYAQDELTIKIVKGEIRATPIAVVPFGWSGAGAPPQDVASIIASDLRRSGEFAPVPASQLPGRPTEASDVRFGDWKILNTEALVIGNHQVLPDGRHSISFRLFEVFKGKQLTGFKFDVAPNDLRRTAHQISDIIYEALTGTPGAFNTRIAYVTARGDQRYVLKVADSDGYGAATVLESSQPVLSPAWSPDGRKLAYVSYEGRQIFVYVQDLVSGTRKRVSGERGINGAPAWSPDGTQLALTLSKDGDPEIYIMDLSTSRLRRVTRNGAIDTEPAWSPDGRSLVFTSDRSGKTQIYQVPAAGGNATRLTFEADSSARATFSPDGKSLALVHGFKGAYRIALLDLSNKSLQTLTDTRLDESPTFAPNGRMLLYATTDNQGAALAAVSVDGNVRQRLEVQQGDVREPAWSPFGKRR